MRTLPVLCLLLVASTALAQDGFSLKDTVGEHLDVLLDGKVAARYMYAYDKARLNETYKPYLHVFDAKGEKPITQGAGGKQFPHHRGIFIGWNKITHGGKSYDRWHMTKGEIVHQRFTEQNADNDSATVTSLTHWNDAAGQPILVEERTMRFKRGPAPARLIIDFTSKLTAPNGDVTLDGDPEHAGIQYRPAGDVVAKETTYVFPREKADAAKDLDYPWVGMTYTLGGNRHSVVHMNHPTNPKGTRYSAYRDYGRFGAFPKGQVTKDVPFEVTYRFLIADGEMPAVEVVQKSWDEFAGAKDATPAPTLTVKNPKK
jgi:hypothetical protein